ncbi:MAG TPA: hypothetical protein VFA09_21460 [Ktedonobacteraceae bacterium]|nr:hypothetical protein [Ktedonobacteraceae bacterium]
MLSYILAGDPLAPWGQAAAILLGLYMFIYILIGLALAAGLMFAFTWVHQKTELIKKLRPTVESVNHSLEEGNKGVLPPPEPGENKIVRAVGQVPMQATKIEKKIDQGSERVAQAVIEFRARTVMVQQMAKAFFLPGLTKRDSHPELEKAGITFKSPGYRILVDKAEKESSDGTVGASQIRALGSQDAEHEAAQHLAEAAGIQAPQPVQAIDRPQSDDAFIR